MADIRNSPTMIAHPCPRYWEDGTVDGVEDDEGTLIPFRFGEEWRITIDLANGRILDWPIGVEADVHYKVCDNGEYWLADADGTLVAHRTGYVPAPLGSGDYVVMRIDGTGAIAGYRRPEIDRDRWREI